MAFDAPRKTLDDIRRELDAEYGASAILDAQADRTVAEDTAPRDAPPDPEEEAMMLLREGRPGLGGWGGYIIAGLVGCIAGQVLILAALAALHYSSGSSVRASTPATSEAPAERVAPTASVASPPRVAPETRDAAPAPEPTVVTPESTVVTPSASRFVPPATASTSAAGDPSGSVAAVTMAPLAIDNAKRAPRRSVRPTPAAPAAAAPPTAAVPFTVPPRDESAAAVAPDAQDWARSQDEVRAALRDWLAQSDQAAADVQASNTVVILGADGQTAKSHVPMRTDGGIVVHEQRWKREANRWNLVDNREAWRSDVAR